MALSGDGKSIFVSPSVCYAGQDLFAASTSLKDPMTNETLTGKVVIQLFIKPGSYQVGPKTMISATEEVDPNINNEELEWTIMQPDSTRIFGLLIKLDEEEVCQDEAVSENHLSCEFQDKCRRFKDLLQLPDDFFDDNNDRRFCIKCHTARGIKPYVKRGTPAKDYWLPIGWCRFGGKIGTHKEAIQLRHTWHIAFHGTRVQNIKPILDGGALVIPGYKKYDRNTIIVSPSVLYAGVGTFTEPSSYEDPVTERTIKAKVVIQVLIKPGGYRVGPQKIGAISAEIDQKFSNQELEWSIVEPDFIRLYGLLIKLDEASTCDGSAERWKCEYQEKCRRFLKLLQLSDDFFDSRGDKCFCTKCHADRGDKLYCVRGDPSKNYWLPIGWCRIGLKMVAQFEVMKLWDIAYQGTIPQDIKPILEGGVLHMLDKRGIERSRRSLGRLRCGYQEKCRRFKESLQLSDDFFDSQNDRCFCAKCLVGIGLYQKRGNPAKPYGLPVGWSRIGFKMESRASSLKVKTEWHVAFHGTREDCVKPILECGHLLIPGDVCLGGKQLSESGGHFNDDRKPTGFDTKQIFVSPSVRYAGHECYAKSTRFVDWATGENFNAKVVFRLYIKPDSYHVGPQTIGATEEIDRKISNQEIEWSTKQRGAIVFYGLLLKLDKTC